MREYRSYGRRATDVLDIGSRAWSPMPAPTPSGVMGGGDVYGRHLARLAEMERRVAELERDNRELAAFAADVAHDLRAPLQAVTGFLELLIRREGAHLDETSQGYAGHILSASGAMRELVEAVLEHRQSSFGALSPNWVHGNELVVGVLRRLQGLFDEAGAVVDVGEMPVVFVDRVQIGRVFQNLLCNAVRAAHPERPPRIAVAARRLSGAWEFSVTDNGVGVRIEERDRIFELFQRGTGDGQRPTGHGLGLAICRTIVERHGGRITVERAPEGGARFGFTVPDRRMWIAGPDGAGPRS